MTLDISQYLKTKLGLARQSYNDLDENESNSAILMAYINEVRNKIFEVLDYSVNHFRGFSENHRDIGFPILSIEQNINSLATNRRYKILINKVGNGVDEYIQDAYKIIFDDEFDKSILLLDESTKHKNTDEILNKKPILNIDYEKIGKIDINPTIYGGAKTDGLAINGGRMRNCVFEQDDGFLIINSLETIEIDGNSLLINTTNGPVRVQIKLFLCKCIDCCENIIRLWNDYQEKK